MIRASWGPCDLLTELLPTNFHSSSIKLLVFFIYFPFLMITQQYKARSLLKFSILDSSAASALCCLFQSISSRRNYACCWGGRSARGRWGRHGRGGTGRERDKTVSAENISALDVIAVGQSRQDALVHKANNSWRSELDAVYCTITHQHLRTMYCRPLLLLVISTDIYLCCTGDYKAISKRMF